MRDAGWRLFHRPALRARPDPDRHRHRRPDRRRRRSGYSEILPNAGVRRVIDSALAAKFKLSDSPNIARAWPRCNPWAAIIRRPTAGPVACLHPGRAPTRACLARKQQLERQLTARYDPDPAARNSPAIESLAGDLSVEAGAVLNTILATSRSVAAEVPKGTNVARILTPGEDLSVDDAYALLVGRRAPRRPPVSPEALKSALIENIRLMVAWRARRSTPWTPMPPASPALRTLAADGTVPPL